MKTIFFTTFLFLMISCGSTSKGDNLYPVLKSWKGGKVFSTCVNGDCKEGSGYGCAYLSARCRKEGL